VIIDLALGFQKSQALQGEHRADHVLADSSGLRLCLGPHQAVDIEAGVPPGENALGPFRAQQLLADKHRQGLPGENLGQPRVVDPRDLMEDACLVHSALSHQEMEVRVKIDPVPEIL
jgi:hypothetical protein